MLQKLNDIWDKWGFEIILGVCLFFLLIYSLIRKGKKGSWSNTYKYSYTPTERKRGPPKESKGEIECRRVLEKLFNKPFPKIRPDFLRNPVTGGEYNCEIDCFSQELRLGVEYNGIQHYKYIPFFHKNKEAFQNQRYRDELKKRMCKDEGVVLIEVPYTVKINEIEKYLISRLKNFVTEK